MRFLGIGLIVIGATVLAAAILAAFFTASENQALNLPILIGGIIISTLFDIVGIVVMKMGPHT